MKFNQIKEFNQLVLEKLQPFFEKYNFKIIESWEGLIHLKSPSVTMRLAYNKMEYENCIFIGLNQDDPSEINNDVLKQVFNSDIKINLLPTEQFLNNLVSFFEKEGNGLVTGDLKTFKELKMYTNRRDKEYNKRVTGK